MKNPNIMNFLLNIKNNFLPEKTKVLIDIVEKEDILKFKRFLKKERDSFPPNFRRFYMASKEDHLFLIHVIRVSFPFFSEESKTRSSNYIRLQSQN